MGNRDECETRSIPLDESFEGQAGDPCSVEDPENEGQTLSGYAFASGEEGGLSCCIDVVKD